MVEPSLVLVRITGTFLKTNSQIIIKNQGFMYYFLCCIIVIGMQVPQTIAVVYCYKSE